MKIFLFLLFSFHMAEIQKDRSAKNIFTSEHTMFVAHRGLTTKHLENTFLALTSAFEQGADGVEFDVQLSKDLVPMVFHDRELLRLTGVDKLIDNVNFEELKKLRQHNEKYSKTYNIPTLGEVLAAMPVHKLINIELKETTGMYGEEGMKHVLEIIEPYKNKLSIVISSFEPEILQLVNKLDPEYALGFLVDDENILLAYINNEIILENIEYIHPHLNLISKDTSKKLLEQKIKLILWGHAQMGEESIFINHKHCALISDIPEELIKNYRQR